MISILYLRVRNESLGSCQAPSEEQCGVEVKNPGSRARLPGLESWLYPW